ncbi:unnamed protein product [Urochloa decumbens]|uniref:Aluminum-activated malate transporter 10 n=1 Tax=Urochloa decumbens TaxID=240449 RepID=A0ABC9F5R9_9POAL
MEMTTTAAKQGAQNRPPTSAPEWRVTVPEGASVTVEQHEASRAARAWAWLVSLLRLALRDNRVVALGRRVWRIGADDPRRAVHGLKVGLALALVSMFYYTRPLYDGVGGAAMWAILTVVVVFEYTVGGCVCKGLNRAIATASATVVALGVHWIASKSGDKLEPFIRSGSVFLLAAMATFSRFIPAVKARFDYGVTIFILTYSLVAVSGYRVGALVAMAQQRVSTIAIGVSICVATCALICPVWAGQELHRATARNMDKLAAAVESIVDDYFSASAAEATSGGDKPPSTGTDSAKAIEGYIRCVLNSKASEDAQANLARWEPPHGRFGLRHPYAQYRNVGAAMRHCAYCVEALAACCVRSASSAGTTAQPGHLAGACTRVAALCGRVLREASGSVAEMATSGALDLAVADMSDAVRELQDDLRALPPSALLMLDEAAQLFTVTSLLIEVSARIEGVVDAVDTLARLANFKPADDEKPAESAAKVEVEP